VPRNATAEIVTGVPVLRAVGAGEMLALKSGRFGSPISDA
jgi:uncharacterized protein YgbK (DUF1537 family)